MKNGKLLAAAGVAAVAYERWFTPWHERWGATDDEVVMALPGDELLAEPARQVTRGITIDAPREDVWPWIVQLGADRGGFYTYDWLENLFGLDIHSADEVVEDWQDLDIGDVVRADRKGTGGWYVVDLRAPDALVLQVADLGAGRPLRRDEKLGWEFQWTFALRDAPSGGTRLLVRERVAFERTLTRVLMAPVGLVSFVMTRGTLRGLQARIEGTRGPTQPAGDHVSAGSDDPSPPSRRRTSDSTGARRRRAGARRGAVRTG